MKFSAYPKYKPSGIDWAGNVPNSWSRKRLREGVNLINGYPFDSDLFSIDEGMPLVRIRDILSKTTELNWAGLPVRAAQIDRDDILVGMDGDFNVARWTGGPAMLNQRVCCLRTRPGELEDRFLFYFLPFPLKTLNDVTYSTTVKHLSSLDLLKFRFYAPAISEQRAIGDFLDRETARLDTLLRRKRELIEKLKEKRSALISRTVTRGLNPNVKLKPSGIEWLGDIPEHWEVKRIKRIGTIRYGLGEPPEYVADGVPFIRATDIKRGKIEMEFVRKVDRSDVPWSRRPELSEGEILVVRSGAYTGDSAIVTREIAGCIAGYDMVLTVTNASARFIAWVFLAKYMLQGQIHLSRLRAAQPHLNAEELGSFILVTPPTEEQRAIADYLDRETAKLDRMMEKVEAAIEKLQEYRTALITAAVTGKIDVRNGRT